MKSNYKRLGDYIVPCDEKNTGNIIKKLQGISNQKYFQKSHTNTIGVDLEKYRIVRTGQFAFNRATTRNGEKISIALRQGKDCIVSPSYRIFKSKNENVLNSEYLMMWFKRPEFDRFARFKSHGSAHEFFDYGEMCEVELPIPSIEKQRELVREYNVIQNRILLNNHLISKLEETAQAIYKHWFVDFEFPDKNGKPYKSNVGKMVWCEELEKEIPEGWILEKLGNIIDYKKGYAFKSSDYTGEGTPIIRVSDLGNKYVETSNFYKAHNSSLFDFYKVKKNDFIITTVGSWPSNPMSVVGKLVRIPNFADSFYLNQNMVRIRFSSELNEIVYQQLIDKSFSDYLLIGAQGSANQASITLEHIFKFKILIPNEVGFNKLFVEIYNRIDTSLTENQKLEELKDLLLAKMTRV